RDLRSFPTRRSSDLNAIAADCNWRRRLRGVRPAFGRRMFARWFNPRNVIVASTAHQSSVERSDTTNPVFPERIRKAAPDHAVVRSEEHTSELQSREN